MRTIDRTLGELVIASPNAAKVFQHHRLDYCCGGKQSLADTCAAAGIDPQAVLREIGVNAGAPEEIRWEQRSLTELVAHILERYHAPLRTELPRLIELAQLVERVHAAKPDVPKGLAALLADVRDALERHLDKEETILFPLITAGRGETAHMPVQVMTQEHEDHGQNLLRIRALTTDLRVPGNACASWRELYRSLQRLEVELMNHIHLENNILFPRSLAG